ncbi:hypothetical protein OFB94_29720, partial [Escherichia coli]|nr:hypothetical protein [Escherichia coli]
EKNKIKIKKIFEQEEWLAEIEGTIAAEGLATELIPDLEQGSSEIEIYPPGGGKFVLDWNMASFVAFQQSVELYQELEKNYPGPFVVGE